jgi:glycosyltransferase involved in cell wall biosynthesis
MSGGGEASPLLSIGLTVFNGGHDIALAIQSIVDQSFADWELILVDDGSTDGTVEHLRQLTDPRIRLIVDGHNRGLAARLNESIGLARGLYFARMDHDDFAHPNRLQAQLDYLATHQDTDLVATRCVSMFDDERVIGELPFAATHAEICGRPWLGFHMPHPSWMGKTEWFRRHLYAQPAPYACEDQELLLRASETSRYHALSEPLLAYRVRKKVGLGKLFRTRLALMRVQAAAFARHGELAYLLLCLVAFVARSASDLLREIAPAIRSDMRALSVAEAAEWNGMIDSCRRRAEQAVDRQWGR